MYEQLALIISVVALTLTLVNLYISLSTFRRTQLGRLVLGGRYWVKEEKVTISVVNSGSRPLTLEELFVGYGSAVDTMAPFFDVLDLLKKKSALAIGEQRIVTIKLVDFRARALAAQIRQGRNKRIWVRARVAGAAGFVDRLLDIELAILPAPVLPAAAPYMAADALIGFPPLEPELMALYNRAARG